MNHISNKLAITDTVYIEKQLVDTIYLNYASNINNSQKTVKENVQSKKVEVKPSFATSTKSTQITKEELALLQQLEGRLEPLDFKSAKQGKSLNDDRIGQILLGAN